MRDFERIVQIGNAGDGMVFCSIKFKDGRLSICGVEGPMRNGNCKGSCGQIYESLRGREEEIKFVDGWNIDLARHFFDVWDRWHLNDTKAGTGAQEQFLRENPVKGFGKASEVLRIAGLNPDNGYEYGSKWLREEVARRDSRVFAVCA